MIIGFLGTGKVARAFGRYLVERKVQVGGFFDRHPERARQAATDCGARAFADLDELARRCDTILITTQDDNIETACRQLAATGRLNDAHWVGHTSGACPSTILQPAADRGARIFSLHPCQAFADPDRAVRQLAGTWFDIEGPGTLEPVLAMIRHLGNPYVVLQPEQKPLYHLAACILSNYLVALVDLGTEAMELAGVRPADGLAAMLPLAAGTLDNIAGKGTAAALTGPIVRADSATVAAHLRALEQAGASDQLKRLYKDLGRRALALARSQRPELAEAYDALAPLLEERSAP